MPDFHYVRYFVILIAFATFRPLLAQTSDRVSLYEAYNAVIGKYPLLENRTVYDSLLELQNKEVNKEMLPKLTLYGEGSYQTEVVQFPETLPTTLDFPNDTYRAYGELELTLYEGGMLHAKRKKNSSVGLINQKELDVALYGLREKVNILFFNILLAREQQALLATSLKDIDNRIAALQAGYVSGTVLESEISKLQVKKLELASDYEELEGDIVARSRVLSAYSGLEITKETQLELPETGSLTFQDQVMRPELALYQAMKSDLEVEKELIRARQLPRISAFAQGGYSNPNRFNFFDTDGKEFAIGGVRLRWNLFDWGISGDRRSELNLQQSVLENQKATFVHNIASRQAEYQENSQKILKQINNAEEIAALQKRILDQYAAQLENGVINVTEYLLQLNAELRARQKLELHKIALKQLQIEYLTLFGKPNK